MARRSGGASAPLRSPLVLLFATGLLAMAAIVVGTTILSTRAADREATEDARRLTDVLAHSVVEPDLPRGLVDGSPAALDRFDRQVLRRLLVGDVRRVKIWRADGTIVYSDRTELIGSRYVLDDDEREVLESAGTEAEVSDLTKPENRFERGMGGMVEVYTRIDSPEGEPLLFEVYLTAASLSRRQAEINASFTPITVGASAVVLSVGAVLVWLLTRRLQSSARERERLLRAAVDASERERRRIARDLHDGVVQDLAGASFAVSAAARDGSIPVGSRDGLAQAADTLRTSQRALRSLLVEIYPPDLDAATLPAALQDLLAPAAARGVEVHVTVGDLTTASPEDVRLVWRVAQEGVRNALRHSGASRLDLAVSAQATGGLELTVADDGHGFEPSSPASGTSLGLRALTGLVEDAGGHVEVTSEQGGGTTLRLLSGGGR